MPRACPSNCSRSFESTSALKHQIELEPAGGIRRDGRIGLETRRWRWFRFADKLTRNPSEVKDADAHAVFRAGWSEAALVETVLTVAWSNFVNRVAFGLSLFADF